MKKAVSKIYQLSLEDVEKAVVMYLNDLGENVTSISLDVTNREEWYQVNNLESDVAYIF